MIEIYGDERFTVNLAGDWSPSKPVAVQDFIVEMRARPRRIEDQEGGLRQPAPLLRPLPPLQLHPARRRGGC